jgi:hypothetical protein
MRNVVCPDRVTQNVGVTIFLRLDAGTNGALNLLRESVANAAQ